MSHEKWWTHQALLSAVNTKKHFQFIIRDKLYECNDLTVSTNDLIAHEAKISEQLMIVSLAISQSSLFVVTMTQERLLALGAHEMLDMPMLSERGDDSLLDRATTCAANRNSHAIVATQTVKLVHIVGCKARAALDLASGRV